MNDMKERIKQDEGFMSYVYKDTMGHATVGYGFRTNCLTKDELALNGGKYQPMSKEVASKILDLKLEKLVPQVFKAFPWLRSKEPKVVEVVVEMSYQMGVDKVKEFKKTLNFIKKDEYEKAYVEGLISSWAKQTPTRAKKVLGGLL